MDREKEIKKPQPENEDDLDMKFSFEYSGIMRAYLKGTKEKRQIKNIEISSMKAKMPYFSYDLVTKRSGVIKVKVRAKKINENTFRVLKGYGQDSCGIFTLEG